MYFITVTNEKVQSELNFHLKLNLVKYSTMKHYLTDNTSRQFSMNPIFFFFLQSHMQHFSPLYFVLLYWFDTSVFSLHVRSRILCRPFRTCTCHSFLLRNCAWQSLVVICHSLRCSTVLNRSVFVRWKWKEWCYWWVFNNFFLLVNLTVTTGSDSSASKCTL